jgi:hypothetical protein
MWVWDRGCWKSYAEVNTPRVYSTSVSVSDPQWNRVPGTVPHAHPVLTALPLYLHLHINNLNLHNNDWHLHLCCTRHSKNQPFCTVSCRTALQKVYHCYSPVGWKLLSLPAQHVRGAAAWDSLRRWGQHGSGWSKYDAAAATSGRHPGDIRELD